MTLPNTTIPNTVSNTMPNIMLSVDGLSKRFSGVSAVDAVSFTLAAGRILGLIGENGAGKTTTMNILGGVLAADTGSVTLDGVPYAPNSPAAATRAGVAFIHQELNLFTNLSVAENLFIDRFPRVGPFINPRAMRRRAQEALREVGLRVAADTVVEQLSPGERQLVEIARALTAHARLIILDEPTTSLTDRETERLFGVLKQLRDAGRSLIYISHILKDVLRLADDILVMRDGRVVGGGPRADFTPARMISLMVGRDLEQLYPTRSTPTSSDHTSSDHEPLLEVRGVTQPGVVRDISLTLRRHEVVGLFGLMGSGRTELARILFGLDPHAQGEIRVKGKVVPRPGPQESIRRGVAFVTEDRRAEGLMMSASVAENLALTKLPHLARPPLGMMDERRLRREAEGVSAALGIRAHSLMQSVKTLSGGNQQKTVIGKWLLLEPHILIVDEPTRGIDVAAKYEVYSILAERAAAGAGVLFISSELEELLGTCDRILVMNNGEISGHFSRAEFDQETLLRAAFREAA